MAPKYNAQSLNQVLQAVADLTAQKTRAREQYSPSTPQGGAPQTPFQGLMSGVIGEHNRRREDVKLQEDAALKQSLAILDLIPDTPENTPKKLQLLTSILHPKTQKGWKEVWNPQADHTAQARFLQQFAGQLPSDSGLSANEQQVRDQQITSGPGALLTQGVNQKYAEQNRGKFQFPDDGQFQGGQIIQTADGLVLVTFDKKTGEPKLKPLGQGKTEKQTVAEIGGKGGAAAANDPIIKRAIAYAKIAANETEGIAYEDFDKLKIVDPERYQQYMSVGNAKAKEYADAQGAAAGLRVPYLQAKTAEALANEKRGGVTGGQAATIQRQDRTDVLKAQQDEADATAEVQRLQQLKDNIWNNWRSKLPNTPAERIEAEMFNRKSTRPEVEEYRKVTAALTAAQTKLAAAKQAKSTLSKSVPRGVGGGTGGQQLDLNRVLRQEQTTTTADTQYTQHEYYIDDVSTPPPDKPIRSLARVYGDPKIFLLNSQRFGIKPGAVAKGQTVTTERGVFLVLSVSSDGSKLLVRKK